MKTLDAFHIMARHLLNQGRRAKSLAPSPENSCLYRAPGGLKCAVGALIPDEVYNPNMEGTTASGLYEKYPDVYECLVLEDKCDHDAEGFYNNMQAIHDSTPEYHWAEKLLRMRANLKRGLEV